MKKRQNPPEEIPAWKLIIGAVVVKAILDSQNQPSLTPLGPEETGFETVNTSTPTASPSLTPSSSDIPAAATIPSPASITPAPTPVIPPTSQIQTPTLQHCLVWDLNEAHADPVTGNFPCLQWATVAANSLPPEPSATASVSKLNGIHLNGDFGRRL